MSYFEVLVFFALFEIQDIYCIRPLLFSMWFPDRDITNSFEDHIFFKSYEVQGIFILIFDK